MSKRVTSLRSVTDSFQFYIYMIVDFHLPTVQIFEKFVYFTIYAHRIFSISFITWVLLWKLPYLYSNQKVIRLCVSPAITSTVLIFSSCLFSLFDLRFYRQETTMLCICLYWKWALYSQIIFCSKVDKLYSIYITISVFVDIILLRTALHNNFILFKYFYINLRNNDPDVAVHAHFHGRISHSPDISKFYSWEAISSWINAKNPVTLSDITHISSHREQKQTRFNLYPKQKNFTIKA